jgi:hypothetical protein
VARFNPKMVWNIVVVGGVAVPPRTQKYSCPWKVVISPFPIHREDGGEIDVLKLPTHCHRPALEASGITQRRIKMLDIELCMINLIFKKGASVTSDIYSIMSCQEKLYFVIGYGHI